MVPLSSDFCSTRLLRWFGSTSCQMVCITPRSRGPHVASRTRVRQRAVVNHGFMFFFVFFFALMYWGLICQPHLSCLARLAHIDANLIVMLAMSLPWGILATTRNIAQECSSIVAVTGRAMQHAHERWTSSWNLF